MTVPSTQVHEPILIKSGITLTLIAAVALATGCGSSSSDNDKPAFEQTPKGQADIKQTAQDKADYTFAQRAEFTKEMKGEIAAINLDIEKLSLKVEKGTDAAKAEAKPKLQALRDQVTALNADLDKVPGATESTWDSVKSGCAKGYASLKDGFQAASKWVSDKFTS
jgi:hypothetical protein